MRAIIAILLALPLYAEAQAPADSAIGYNTTTIRRWLQRTSPHLERKDMMTLVADCTGNGDYTTVKAAVDAANAMTGANIRKTVLVRPGCASYTSEPFSLGEFVALDCSPSESNAFDISQRSSAVIQFTGSRSGAMVTMGRGSAIKGCSFVFAGTPTAALQIIKYAGFTGSSYASLTDVDVRYVSAATLTDSTPVTMIQSLGASGGFEYLAMVGIHTLATIGGGEQYFTHFVGSGTVKNYLADSWLDPNSEAVNYLINLTGSTSVLSVYNTKLTNAGGTHQTFAGGEIVAEAGSLVWLQGTPSASTGTGITALDRSDGVQTLTIADSGNGSAAAGTVEPRRGSIEVTCSDTDGCTLVLTETAVAAGHCVSVVNVSAANTVSLTSSAGAQSLPTGGVTLGPTDTATLCYLGGLWAYSGGANNAPA